MKTTELAAEMHRDLANLERGHMEELVGYGVPVSLIADHLMAGIMSIRLEGDLYCADPDGAVAYISPVRVEYADTPESTEPWWFVRCGDLIDLLAWDPAAPDTWAVRAGTASWLGCVAVQMPELMPEPPTRVWRTPLDWYRSDCNGLVLLSRERADQYRVLGGLEGGIEAMDEAHARELRAVLRRPWMAPRVRPAPQTRVGAYRGLTLPAAEPARKGGIMPWQSNRARHAHSDIAIAPIYRSRKRRTTEAPPQRSHPINGK